MTMNAIVTRGLGRYAQIITKGYGGLLLSYFRERLRVTSNTNQTISLTSNIHRCQHST